VEIEAIVASCALEFGLEIEIAQAILEGHFMVIMNALEDDELSWAFFALLIQDAKVFSRSFTQLLYSHIRREGNNLVHSLARHSINVSNYTVWMEDVPLFFHYILYTDIASSF